MPLVPEEPLEPTFVSTWYGTPRPARNEPVKKSKKKKVNTPVPQDPAPMFQEIATLTDAWRQRVPLVSQEDEEPLLTFIVPHPKGTARKVITPPPAPVQAPSM